MVSFQDQTNNTDENVHTSKNGSEAKTTSNGSIEKSNLHQEEGINYLRRRKHHKHLVTTRNIKTLKQQLNEYRGKHIGNMWTT